MTTTTAEPPILLELDGFDALSRRPLLVDTRRGPDYRRGHIPGAVHLDTFPYANQRTDREGWPATVGDWRRTFASAGIRLDEDVVFYDGGLENRAARNGFMLRFLGHPRAFVLHGGMAAWLRSGRPASKEVAAREPVAVESYPARTRDEMVATVDEVAGVLGREDVVLLDVRDRPEFEGRRRLQWNPRMGRIPGGRLLEWTSLLEQDPQAPALAGTPYGAGGMRVGLRPEGDIRRKLAEVGVTPESDVVVYCQKSHRASTVFLALQRLGYRKARVYPGSFREWSRRKDLPVER